MLGVTIGSYVVRAKLATGGMGAVYLAEHTALDKRAAVKVLLPEFSTDREVVKRFFNEAKAASAIHHPSIVEIYDVGYTADGQAYIVMELLEGETLGARCQRAGRLELRRAMLFARQIAGGLAAAHERGIIHRDLKPDNVLVVRDPEVPGGERVKLLDFGVAKLQSDLKTTQVTQIGSVLGTPRYMAPEQCLGLQQIDGRADLYALGCVLYELLLGRPPFEIADAGIVMSHHLNEPVRPPRELDPQLPAAVEQIVMQLLEKDPAKRPQHAGEVVAAIDRAGFGSDLAAAAPHPPMRVPTTPLPTTLTGASGIRPPTLAPRARRWLVPAVAGVVIAAGLGVYAVVGGSDTQSAAVPAAEPAVVAPAPAPAPEPEPAPEPAPEPPPPPAAAPKPPPVALAVDSDPSGAKVLVDGKQIGTTPYREKLDPRAGERTYTVEKAGYEAATATLSTDRDGSQKLVLKKKRHTHTTKSHDVGDRGVNPFD